jgi:type III secretion protein L
LKGKKPNGRDSESGVEESSVEDKARLLLVEAQRQANQRIEATRQEVQGLLDAARGAGEKDGFAQAEHMRDEIAGLEQRMLKEVEGEVVRAAFRVARELLIAELASRDDAVVDVACTALAAAKQARDINLRAHPQDVPQLRAQKERLLSVLGRARDLEIREDRRVRPGGVLIETESGVIDAQLQTQLEELSRVLGA